MDTVTRVLEARWRSRVTFVDVCACAGFTHMWRVSLAAGGIDGRRRALPLSGGLFAGEVLTYCSRARIVECNCR